MYQVKELLLEKIIEVLRESLSSTDINNIISQLRIEYFQNSYQIDAFYDFLKLLNSSMAQNKIKNINFIENWQKAIEIYSDIVSIASVSDYSYEVMENVNSYPREKLIAQALEVFKKYNIEVKDGKFILDNHKIIKVVE